MKAEDASVGCEFLDRESTPIHALHLAAVAPDGPLIVEVGFSVVADPLRADRQGRVIERLAFEPPGQEHLTVLQHQIPVLATFDPMM